MELEIRHHIQNDLTHFSWSTVLTHAQWRCPLQLINNWVWLGGRRKWSTFADGGNLLNPLQGFSYCVHYCSAWVEKYKAKHKKSVQKSKSVRKQLFSSSHTKYNRIIVTSWYYYGKIVQDTKPRQINSIVIVIIIVYYYVLCNLIKVHFQFLKLYM